MEVFNKSFINNTVYRDVTLRKFVYKYQHFGETVIKGLFCPWKMEAADFYKMLEPAFVPTCQMTNSCIPKDCF
jgi:hypothetical protein